MQISSHHDYRTLVDLYKEQLNNLIFLIGIRMYFSFG